MKNKFLLSSLFGVTAALVLGLAAAPKATIETIAPLRQQTTSDVLYYEDFEGELTKTGWTADFNIADGVATNKGEGAWVDVPLGDNERTSDNNYEVSFDLKYDASASLYFHIVGLDATTPGNIYLELINGGTYWRLANFGAGDIYDNSGEDQGSRWIDNIRINKMKSEGVNLKFVIIDDVIEVFVDDYRIIAVTLGEFGNRRYSERRALEKGTITGFGFDIRGEEASCVVDNFLVTPVHYGSTYYATSERIGGGGGWLPLTYKNLYKENYHVEADFEVHRTLVENSDNQAYPRIQILSNFQNGPQAGDPNANINAQVHLDREFANPWIGAIGNSGSWGGPGTSYVACDYNGYVAFKLAVDVKGNGIIYTVTAITPYEGDTEHNKQVIETTYEGLDGIDKDELLGFSINNHFTDVTYFEYFGFDGDTGVHASADKDIYVVGDTVTATAKMYGAAATGFEWKLDGESTGVTETTYTNSSLTEGTHTLVYTNGTVSSEEVTVEVVTGSISISADKNTIYLGEEVTFNATTVAIDASETINWYLNGEATGLTGATITTTELPVGTHSITATAGTYTSNTVTVTVKAPEIKLSSEQTVYFVGETATITAEKKAVADTDTLSWYVNNELVADATSDTLSLTLDGYEGGDLIEVTAKTASGIASEALVLTIAENSKTILEADENWTNVYRQEVTEAFGPYEVLEDAEGKYYHPTNADGGNDATFPGVTFTSTKWSMEYDLYIPESVKDYGGEYYVYPQLLGFDSKNSGDWVEFAVAVGSEKVRTYIKTHVSGLTFGDDNYGLGNDLSYATGAAKFGWNHIAYFVDGNKISAYVNDVMTMFFTLDFATVPSGACMSMFPGSGGSIPLGFKNFSFNSIVLPAPDVASVTVSASKVTCEIGESVVLTATVAPYNAEPKEIKWYVNGTQVECSELRYTFVAELAGEYTIVCEIDGVRSEGKVITVNAPKAESKGCGGSIIASSAIVSVAALVGIIGLALSKKRKED